MVRLLFIFLFACTNFLFAQKSAVVKSEYIYKKAPFKKAHASTIESTSKGLIAAWFGGTHEKNKDVEIWLSRKINGYWTEPVSVADGIQHADLRYPTWNPVLFNYPNGPLVLFYKVGPDPKRWWGVMKTSNDFGKTWSKGYRLPEGILGPIKNKPILLGDSTLISPSSTEDNGWQIHFEITKDQGKTWKRIGPINSAEKYNVIQPSILRHGADTLQILARSKENRIITSWSYDGGYHWTPLEATHLPNPNSGTDAVTLDDGLQLLVYNPTKRKGEEWGGKRTPLCVAISKDGKKWHKILTLEEGPGEYSYPAVIQSEDGMVHITYTWKRERIKHVVLNPDKFNMWES